MRTLRRSEERESRARGKEQSWRTVWPGNVADFPISAFRGLVLIDEERLAPGGSLSGPAPDDLEVVTYVREGALSFQDASGRSGVVTAGEFRCTTAALDSDWSQSNLSSSDAAHVFRIFLRLARTGLAPHEEQRRFSAGQRRGGFRVVAAPDGRGGSLRLHSHSFVYSALLDAGKHVVHALEPGRAAWVHVVKGAVMFGELVLGTGDGAGVTDDRAVSLTAREESELLLLDLYTRQERPIGEH